MTFMGWVQTDAKSIHVAERHFEEYLLGTSFYIDGMADR